MMTLPRNPTHRLPGSAFLKAVVLLALLLAIAACSETGVTGAMKSADAAEADAMSAPSMIIEPAPMPEPVIGPYRTGRDPRPRRGVVTAGDIDDTLNIKAFQTYQARASRQLGLPRTSLAGLVQMQLVAFDGSPAPGVPVTLRKPGAATPFYQGHSGVDGRISVIPSVHGGGTPQQVELRAFGPDQADFSSVHRTGQPHLVRLPFKGGWQPDFLDLVFVFDTTGSMGDELDWLTREFSSIVSSVRRTAPGASIRYGLVAYRDHGDQYVVRNFGFTNRQSRMQGWLRSLNANGGGDYPEAAASAMQAAAGLNWRRGKGERLLFHIADAPPHERDARAYLGAARALAAKNVQIFGLGASGVAEESELLMRQAAVASAGRYLFLTDDSGVGHSHAEPTIACYRVTLLKSLLIRVLSSELSGHRREARPNQIIREVGTYRDGVCLQ
jgi:hypothetical protein